MLGTASSRSWVVWRSQLELRRALKPVRGVGASRGAESPEGTCCRIAVRCITMHCKMESQLTVRLPQELSTALERASRRSGRKTSDIVRAALREYLQLGSAKGNHPAERVRGLIGSLDSGLPDLAEQHRAYVLESLKRGR